MTRSWATTKSAGGSGSQTPWTSDINGATFKLQNVGGIAIGTTPVTTGSKFTISGVANNTTYVDFRNGSNVLDASFFKENGSGHFLIRDGQSLGYTWIDLAAGQLKTTLFTADKTLDWKLQKLYSLGGFSPKMTMNWAAAVAYDGTEVQSIDWNNRKLYDTGGANQALDWQYRYLTNASGQATVDWDNKLLYDPTTGNNALHWGNRLLVDSTGFTATDWQNRTLNATDASTNLNWSSPNGVFIKQRFISITPDPNPTIDVSTGDIFSIVGLNTDIADMSVNLTSTPYSGQTFRFEFTDDGTPRNINWGALFGATTVPLPVVTVPSTLLRVWFTYDTASSLFMCYQVV